MCILQPLGYPNRDEQESLAYWVEVQADLSFCWSHRSYFRFSRALALLEVPCSSTSNEYLQHMFSWRNKKNIWILFLPGAMSYLWIQPCHMKRSLVLTWIVKAQMGSCIHAVWSGHSLIHSSCGKPPHFFHPFLETFCSWELLHHWSLKPFCETFHFSCAPN